MANLNEAGTLYWVVVEHGALYPKPIQGSGAVDLTSDEAKLQVMAGMNALKSGSTAMTANKDVSFKVSGLEAEKTYDLYYVAQGPGGQLLRCRGDGGDSYPGRQRAHCDPGIHQVQRDRYLHAVAGE